MQATHVHTYEKKLLIIDDEPLIRRTLADYLTAHGYHCVTAADGAIGLDQARQEPFHAVLVDLRMPNVGGLEVIKTLKAKQPELPVVVISGTGVLNEAVEAIRQGAWDYITKPVRDMKEILVVVERVLDKARLRAERDRYQREIEQLNRSLEAEVARQTQDLRTQNRELMALNQVSYAISAPVDLDTMLQRVTGAAMEAVDGDGCEVRLLDPAGECLTIAATQGLPDDYLASAQAIPLGEGMVGGVAQSGQPSSGEGGEQDPWLASLFCDLARAPEADGFASYVCVPLRAGEDVVGTLGIFDRQASKENAHRIELLTVIGNQIGVAVARSHYAGELKGANEQLERVNAELLHTDRLREQFIQNVAHELRTPLALVRGYVEMLAEDDLQAQQKEMALRVSTQRVQELVDLVESITTLQDMSYQALEIVSVTPCELIQTAMHMCSQRARNVGIQMHSECPDTLSAFQGDFTRLSQALHQLLDNACKFSPQGGVITVRAGMDHGEICFSVIDQGIGISTQEHERIFDRFYQVDGSTTRRYGGTGLGLAIAKEIVEAHQGCLRVQSEVGQGSTFTVTLPLDLERME